MMNLNEEYSFNMSNCLKVFWKNGALKNEKPATLLERYSGIGVFL